MIELKTRWGKNLEKENVHQEYPRPQFVRDSFFSLNGVWEYAINQNTEVENYDGEIVVPFSPEANLSGVNRIVTPDDYLHYRKVFQIPNGFKKDRVILHFGAVDQECIVYLNGSKLGEHLGGYLAFQFDVTEYLISGENELKVCVKDWTEKSPHARGKQRYKKGKLMSSLFYTSQSGIWKSVWMESVAETHITNIKLTPMFDEASVAVEVYTNIEDQKGMMELYEGEKLLCQTEWKTEEKLVLPLKGFHAWTPENPFLYDVKVKCVSDEVSSYFGMRKFSVEKDSKGILRFFFNNKPYFFNGVLDQGYWPDGLLTPPSDEALAYDILKLKELGYNTIRKHIKVESDRFYYHCDKIGMMVWQDMPNGGGDYNMIFVTYLPNVLECVARGIKDNKYAWFKRSDENGRKQYYEDLKGMVTQLYNHPSIATWVPFNEGWGQFDAAKATELIRSMDSTRLVNEACGWFDQHGGDMFSIHNYLRKLKVKPQKDRVVALTEFGGYAFPIPGHLACDKEFGYKNYKTKEELTAAYKKVFEEDIYSNLENGLCSAIYTQTSDIEEEINGLMTYDREVNKFEEDVLKEVHQELYRKFNQVI